MLILPEFTLERPRTFAEAVALLAQTPDAKPLAGGTDLVPNMKHGLFEPSVVVDLKRIEEGRQIDLSGPVLRLGALCTLDALANHPEVQEVLPALATACSLIAGPQLRRMGTLGGNLCLETRCVYYNQTYFWRSALGYCLKKDGTVCHVVESGRRCVAAASNDTAPVLIALGASVTLLGPAGARDIPLERFYVADGIKNTVVLPGELVTGVTIPRPAPGTQMSYQKLRTRQAIDFPLLSLALVREPDAQGLTHRLQIVMNALGAKPRLLGGLDSQVIGKPLSDEVVSFLADQVYRQAHPLSNIAGDLGWRREMGKVLLRRAIADIVSPA